MKRDASSRDMPLEDFIGLQGLELWDRHGTKYMLIKRERDEDGFGRV